MQSNGERNLALLRNDLHTLSAREEVTVDSGYEPLCRKLNSHLYWFRMPKFENREITPFIYEHDDTSIVLFSGGKVSTAVALRLRDLHKNIVLLHFKLKDAKEEALVESLMEDLKLPFIITDERASYGGYDKFTGIRMIQIALEVAYKNHYSPVVYTGMFEMASIEHNKKIDWKYCAEFIGTYTDIVKRYIAGAKVLCIMPNYAVAEDEILKHKKIKSYFMQ